MSSWKERPSGIVVRDRVLDAPKPQLNFGLRSDVVLERLADDGTVLDRFEGPNTVTADARSRFATCISSATGFFTGLKVQLATSATATDATKKQDATTTDYPTTGSYRSIRGLFPKAQSNITGINHVLVRRATSPFTVYAYSALTGLTRTTTAGTNPFTANASKGTNDQWRIQWRAGLTLAGVAGLSAQNQTDLINMLLTSFNSSRYVGADDFEPLVTAVFPGRIVQGQPPGTYTHTPTGQTSQISASGAVATFAVTAPGPRPDLTSRRTGRTSMRIGAGLQGSGRNTILYLWRQQSPSTFDWGASTAGGTLTVTVTIS